MAVALVLTGHIGELERVITLALFIPIVSATTGSVGIQSLAASLTTTAPGVSAQRGALAVIMEARSGLVLGTVSGVIAGGLATLWKSDVMLGVVIAGSMAASLTMAAILGASVPGVLTKMRIDPAIASGPLITTLNDAISLSIYLAVAGWLLAGR